MIKIRNMAWSAAALAMLTAGSFGCAGKGNPQAGEPAPESQGRLEVVNRSSADMDIYLVHGGQRVRLGLAPGSETTNFSLTRAQLVGAGSVHFEAIPLAGLGRPVSSEPIMGASALITLDIPPN